MADYPRRTVLFRWVGWFALVNALVLTLLGLRYLANFSSGGTVLSWVYLVLVFPSHFLMLAFLPVLALVPVILAWPSRRWATALAVMCFATLIAATELDSLLWAQSRFHINGLTVQILGLKSWVFSGIIFMVGLFFEFFLATWTWRWVERRQQRHGLATGL
jgi:membrane-anchored protein YejM (alkaline phosphatase superfamily)